MATPPPILSPGFPWNFFNPVQIIFGEGSVSRLPDLVGSGEVLLVTTPGFTKRGVTAKIREAIGANRLLIFDQVEPNPGLSALENDITHLLTHRIDSIIALGGGSALDAAKALSVALAGGTAFSLRQHFEQNAPLPAQKPLPVIAVPTTAGTGSEVTPFATIWDHEKKRKHSLASPRLFPKTALLDPRLTLSVSGETTIFTGLDALSQGFESLWNRNATTVTLAYSVRAISLALETLPLLAQKLEELPLRTNMMEASLLAGLAISQTRTAMAHSISYPLTAHYGMPHGLACSFTLPALLEFNSHADDGRLVKLAKSLGNNSALELKTVLEELLKNLGVWQALPRYVTGVSDILKVADEMFTPGRADNNLRSMKTSDLQVLLSTLPLK